MSYRLPLLAASFLIAAALTSRADDWPQWRGPTQDGVSKEKGLLQSWPKDGPPLVWTGKNLGIGFGTPSVAGGKVYGIGNRDGKDGVWALKEADGTEAWFTPFADKGKPKLQQNNGPASTPSVAGGKVFAVSMNGTVAALNADTGKLIWQKSYIGDFGAGMPLWGFSGSVLVDGNKVICSPCGPKAAIAALKADTGDVAWTTVLGDINTEKGGAGYSTPVKATVNGVAMYVVVLDQANGLVGVHADTGEVLFKYNKAALGGTAQIPTPIVKGDRVWLSTGYGGGSALLQLVPEGTKKFAVKEVKTYKQDLMNHHGGSVLVGDHLYFGHGQNQGYPACVDFKTGDLVWGPILKDNEVGGGKGSAAYAYADGRLYVRYQNRVMDLEEPSPEGLKLVSSFTLPPANVSSHSTSWPHPVIANGKLFIRDQNVMYVYNVKA